MSASPTHSGDKPLNITWRPQKWIRIFWGRVRDRKPLGYCASGSINFLTPFRPRSIPTVWGGEGPGLGWGRDGGGGRSGQLSEYGIPSA